MNNKTKRVINGYTHKEYHEVTELNKFYTQIVTGKGYGELIVNYKPRETTQQKAQRVRITQNRTKSIAGKVEGFFKRVFRADKLKLDVSHENDEQSAEIGQYLNNYGNDGQNLLTWSEETALFYNNIDPNAFYWVRHTVTDGLDNFDPFIFTSEEVKDYKIDKGAVNYCVCQLSETVRYMADNTQREKLINIFYTFTVDGLEIAIELNDDILINSEFYEQFKNELGTFENVQTVNDKAYIIIFEPSDVGAVPVTRVGYKHDKNTGGKTYVSFWDSATEEYKQLVNRGSEYDLSLTLHAFLQKIQYYTPCDYQDTDTHAICRGGTLHPNGDTCPNCSGTGKQVHTSSQDVIEVQLPNADGEPVAVAPKDLVFYVNVPFDIVKQQKTDVSEYTPKIIESIFGVDISHQQSGNATATQITNYYDTAQDSLYEFTKAPQRIFLFTIDLIAKTLQIDDVKSELLYTNEYDLESENYLVNLLKLAKDAGANSEAIENINKRLNVKQNRTDSAYFSVYNAMRKFEPFATIPAELKKDIILDLPNSSIQKALYLNFKEITEDILNNEPAFLILDYNQQKQIVTDKAGIYADQAIKDNSPRQIREFNDINETNIFN
jgi:hypothetical protein